MQLPRARSALVLCAIALLPPGSALAQGWSDDFDSYAPGPLPWTNCWNSGGASLSDAQAHSGTNSLFALPGTDTVAAWNTAACVPASTGRWYFDAWVYHPSNSVGQQYWIMLNTYQPGAAAQYSWSVQVHMDATAGTVACDCQGMNSPIPAALGYNRWVRLHASIDLNADTVELSYDGVPLTTAPYSWTGTVFGGGAGNLEIQALDVYPASASGIYWDTISLTPQSGAIGINYCLPAANSTGVPARMSAAGSVLVASNNVTLTVSSVPAGQFGYFITSESQGYFSPATSSGFVCLGGAIGRYNSSVGTGPTFSLVLDLNAVPTPSGLQAVLAGDSRNFQFWHRDVGGGSNFSDGLNILFN